MFGIARIREFVDGGIVVTDSLTAPDGGEILAIRTIIQIGGDTTTQVCPKLLRAGDFARVHARHHEHVRRTLVELRGYVRNWRVVRVLAALPSLAVLLIEFEQLLGESLGELLGQIIAWTLRSALALLLAALLHWGVGALLRWLVRRGLGSGREAAL